MNETRSLRLAQVGLLGALAVVLSLAEGVLAVPILPGARLGLANVAVTAALYLLGPFAGIGVAGIKVMTVLLTRGVTAALMAGVGTLCSVAVTAGLLPLVRRERLTFVGVSIASATAHTLGQLLAARGLLGGGLLTAAPWWLLGSLPTGLLTGLCLNVLTQRLAPLLTYRKEKE